MGAEEIDAFLTHLAVEKNGSASTQNQALSALLFLYKEALQENVRWVADVVRATRPKRLPVVFTRGLRIMEAVRLRVKDLDLARGEIMVRDGKGRKDRITMLSRSLGERLVAHLAEVRELHDR